MHNLFTLLYAFASGVSMAVLPIFLFSLTIDAKQGKINYSFIAFTNLITQILWIKCLPIKALAPALLCGLSIVANFIALFLGDKKNANQEIDQSVFLLHRIIDMLMLATLASLLFSNAIMMNSPLLAWKIAGIVFKCAPFFVAMVAQTFSLELPRWMVQLITLSNNTSPILYSYEVLMNGHLLSNLQWALVTIIPHSKLLYTLFLRMSLLFSPIELFFYKGSVSKLKQLEPYLEETLQYFLKPPVSSQKIQVTLAPSAEQQEEMQNPVQPCDTEDADIFEHTNLYQHQQTRLKELHQTLFESVEGAITPAYWNLAYFSSYETKKRLIQRKDFLTSEKLGTFIKLVKCENLSLTPLCDFISKKLSALKATETELDPLVLLKVKSVLNYALLHKVCADDAPVRADATPVCAEKDQKALEKFFSALMSEKTVINFDFSKEVPLEKCSPQHDITDTDPRKIYQGLKNKFISIRDSGQCSKTEGQLAEVNKFIRILDSWEHIFKILPSQLAVNSASASLIQPIMEFMSQALEPFAVPLADFLKHNRSLEELEKGHLGCLMKHFIRNFQELDLSNETNPSCIPLIFNVTQRSTTTSDSLMLLNKILHDWVDACFSEKEIRPLSEPNAHCKQDVSDSSDFLFLKSENELSSFKYLNPKSLSRGYKLLDDMSERVNFIFRLMLLDPLAIETCRSYSTAVFNLERIDGEFHLRSSQYRNNAGILPVMMHEDVDGLFHRSPARFVGDYSGVSALDFSIIINSKSPAFLKERIIHRFIAELEHEWLVGGNDSPNFCNPDDAETWQKVAILQHFFKDEFGQDLFKTIIQQMWNDRYKPIGERCVKLNDVAILAEVLVFYHFVNKDFLIFNKAAFIKLERAGYHAYVKDSFTGHPERKPLQPLIPYSPSHDADGIRPLLFALSPAFIAAAAKSSRPNK